eukprot:4381804-Alexandrium_andersonii.AAC.1
MSASLVGSEMCIRDRGALLAFDALATHPCGWVLFRLGPPSAAPTGRVASCLLYTSDAADDM